MKRLSWCTALFVALNPEPQTLNPEPQILNAKPQCMFFGLLVGLIYYDVSDTQRGIQVAGFCD